MTPPDVTPVSEALSWLAAEKTTAEALAGASPWSFQTPEQRIAANGKRADARDAAILNARNALTRAAADGGVAVGVLEHIVSLTINEIKPGLPPGTYGQIRHVAREALTALRAVPLPPVAAGSADLRAENERLRDALEVAGSDFDGIYHYTFEAGTIGHIRRDAEQSANRVKSALSEGAPR